MTTLIIISCHCHALGSVRQDCFYNENNIWAYPSDSGTLAIDFNRYSYDNNTDVVSIPLCPNENGSGDNCVDKDQAYVVEHRLYNKYSSLDNDFALIILPNTTAVNEGIVANIRPVRLNEDDDVPADGEELETFGWGERGSTLGYPRVPYTILVEQYSQDKCGQDWGTGVTENMLCITTEAVGSGDSGMIAYPHDKILSLTGVPNTTY